MINPIKRFKEWKEYKAHLRDMKLCIKNQKALMEDDTLDETVKNKLFKLHVKAFVYHANAVTAYQAKYFHKKS